jgi:hypothetical protein
MQATTTIGHDASYWHESDVPGCRRNVRYRGYTGSDLLALSFTGFDPYATSSVQICCGAQGGFSSRGVIG